MTLTHPLISKHSIVRALRPENTHLDLKLPEMEFLQGERSIFYTVCARKQTNGPPIIAQGFSIGSCNHHYALKGRAVDPPTSPYLQAAATGTMHCQAERWNHPPPPILPFVLVQNLSLKRIVPTDNMRPKLG